MTIDTVGLVPRSVTSAAPSPLNAPSVTGVSGAARPEITVAATIAPQRPSPFGMAATASPAAAMPIGQATVVPMRAPAIPVDATDDPATDNRIIKFGSRKPKAELSPASTATPKARRSPRLTGLILTVLLLLAMFAVAAWATMTDTVVSRWLGGTTAEDVTVAGSVVVPVAVPTAAPADDAAANTTLPDATLPTASPDTGTGTDTGTDTGTAPDAFAAAAAAAAVATAISGLSQTQDATSDDATLAADDVALASPSLTDAGEPVTGTAVSADEADRFYAATGVWLRAPRLPLTPQTDALDDIYTTALDAGLTDRAAANLPPLGPDPGLVTQMNPPAPGTQFPRDARGFILATPEGTVTPDGLLIFAGQPALVPPTRPGTVAPESVADPETATAIADATATVDATATAQPMATAPTIRLQARPETTAPVETALGPDGETVAGTDPTATDGLTPEAAELAAVTPGGVSLAGVVQPGVRPLPRPVGIVPEGVDPAAPETQLAAYDGTRPSVRPEGLAPEGATSSPEDAVTETPETAADPALALSETLSSIVDGAADPLASATTLAVPVARRPDARPTNFSRVVEQQTARLARAQPAAPASAPATAPATAPASGNASAEEQAETEPEVASSAAAVPSGPVSGGVAATATFEDAMALREINLIGVFGQPNDRRALVRLSNGRYIRVEVGDSLDGGQVAAISDNALNYVKRGRTLTLQIPSE